jgi:hypothetical protein
VLDQAQAGCEARHQGSRRAWAGRGATADLIQRLDAVLIGLLHREPAVWHVGHDAGGPGYTVGSISAKSSNIL